jgi:23S rRNA (cytosine1962-C5)-methyltransferase
MNNYPKIVLKSGRDQSVRRFHPWIFSGAIKNIPDKVTEGDIVEIYDNKNNYLATGHYQNSTIAVRIFTFDKQIIDKQFWATKLQDAINRRRAAGLSLSDNLNVFRLVHGEGDGLPGLITDYYNGIVVIQAHSAGMYLQKDIFSGIISSIPHLPVNTVYDKSALSVPFKSPVKPVDGFLLGNKTRMTVNEYGNRYVVDIEQGQKTGFYIDQRENRRLLQTYTSGKTVLNMFCYTGGFSVAALNGGANVVHSVDSSKPAIELTEKSILENFNEASNHQGQVEDAFDFLAGMEKDTYNLIILDPPAFAKHHKVKSNALKGYRKINTQALSKVKKGGLVFTFSCSQAISKHEFREAVFSAAAIAGREVVILHQLSQPPDHPINIYHPEGEYLKGLVLGVE